jgi:hypothetical protein
MRPTITRRRVAAAAVAVSLAATGAVTLAASSEAAAATYKVSPDSGPGGATSTAKVVSIVGKDFKSATGTVKVGTVSWVASGTACSAAAALSGFAVPTSTQVVVTVPANTLALGGTNPNYTKKDYTLCVYDTAGTPALLGSGKYTVYPPATVTAISPAKGATVGGSTIAVDGTNFTAKSVVKVGTNVATQVAVAKDGKSLTAKVPAGSAGAADVTVTTEAGAATPTLATTDDYTYVSAVSVSPSTGVGANDLITVSGVGFSALDFTLAKTKIYLSPGSFSAAALPSELCGSVQVVSDTQLVCSSDASVADGAYTVVVVGDNTSAVTAAATATATSSSAAYTVADF